MKIAADTLDELQEAIAAHSLNGWYVAEHKRQSDGTHTATLVRERIGGWITTYTGKQFWPLDPRPEDICIEDIAHSLALQCRYNGHTQMFYSVAEHCVHLSRYVAPHRALWALLHDASETYLCDIPSPIKPMLEGYAELESNITSVINKKFGLIGDIPIEVDQADKRIVADEMHALCTDSSWTDGFEPLGIEIECWDFTTAEHEFMNRFREIFRNDCWDEGCPHFGSPHSHTTP